MPNPTEEREDVYECQSCGIADYASEMYLESDSHEWTGILCSTCYNNK